MLKNLFILIFILNSLLWSQSYKIGDNALKNNDFTKAFNFFMPLANDGDNYAELKIAKMFEIGLGVPPNLDKALKYYKKSFNNGNSQVFPRLIKIYTDTERWDEYFLLLEKEKSKKNYLAQKELGLLYNHAYSTLDIIKYYSLYFQKLKKISYKKVSNENISIYFIQNDYYYTNLFYKKLDDTKTQEIEKLYKKMVYDYKSLLYNFSVIYKIGINKQLPQNQHISEKLLEQSKNIFFKWTEADLSTQNTKTLLSFDGYYSTTLINMMKEGVNEEFLKLHLVESTIDFYSFIYNYALLIEHGLYGFEKDYKSAKFYYEISAANRIQDAVYKLALYFKDKNSNAYIQFLNLSMKEFYREEVSCSNIPKNNLGVIILFGQSHVTNNVDKRFRPTSNVYEFYNNKCYKANDPFLGPNDFSIQGSVMSRLGELLIQEKVFNNIIFSSIGYTGSSSQEWAKNGKFNKRIGYVIQNLYNYNLSPSFFLWQQGQADVSKKTSAYTYTKNIKEIFSTVRSYTNTPIFFSKASKCMNMPQYEKVIRNAQNDFINLESSKKNNFFKGINEDAVDERWDGCHFTDKGAWKVANMWANIIKEYKKNNF